MLATGRIDLVARTSRYIYVIELKLKNIGIELDDEGKGLLGWKKAE